MFDSTQIKVARRMWKLQKKGWKPRRTILFCNWDAEEYGLVSLHLYFSVSPFPTAKTHSSINIELLFCFQIGSVEWVEENRQMLESRAVAYLNVDVAVAGAGFETSATPQLDELLVQSAKQVKLNLMAIT